jgi:hypothetical protein
MEFTEQESGTLIDAPIPGESLTSDPEQPKAWETPPEYTRVEEFIDDMFDNITKEENISGILDPIRKGIAIEDVAQMLLFGAFQSGKITTDLMLGSIEPTIYMLIGLAEFAGIPDPQLYPEDDMLDDDDDVISILEKEASSGVDFKQMTTPQGTPRGLVDKIKEVKNGKA